MGKGKFVEKVTDGEEEEGEEEGEEEEANLLNKT